MPAIVPLAAAKLNWPTLYGKNATVVVFWKSDRRMAQQELHDLGPEVVEPFGKVGVAVVGIAVKESEADAEVTLKKASANFTNLLDAERRGICQSGQRTIAANLSARSARKDSVVRYRVLIGHPARAEPGAAGDNGGSQRPAAGK